MNFCNCELFGQDAGNNTDISAWISRAHVLDRLHAMNFKIILQCPDKRLT